MAAEVAAKVAAESAAKVVGQGGGQGCWPGLWLRLLPMVVVEVVGQGGGRGCGPGVVGLLSARVSAGRWPAAGVAPPVWRSWWYSILRRKENV